MKKRENFLSKIWRKLRRKPAKPAPVQLRSDAAAGAKHEARDRVRQSIEPLEGRVAPAVLVNPSTVMFKDLNGDDVTVKFSKPVFDTGSPTLAADLADVFKFSDGTAAVAFDSTGPQQLQLLDLTSAPFDGAVSRAAGTSVIITAKRSGGQGDDLTDVGAINAAGLALGAVTIDGDLGQIDAGSDGSETAIKSLTVNSLGVAQGTQLGTASFESRIVGALGALNVATDIKEAYVHVVNGTGILGFVTAVGKIGNVTVKGSLIGRAAVEAASNNTGLIEAAAGIGAVKIGTDLGDGIVGGGGTNSGAIIAVNGIKSLTVSGNVAGGGGQDSGSVFAGGDIGAVRISGSLLGAAGVGSGGLFAGGKIGGVNILGAVTGGSGDDSATILAGTSLGNVTIGDTPGEGLTGGDGKRSAVISSGTSMGAVKIAGNIVGDGMDSGGIFASGRLKSVTVAGNLTGALDGSGFINGGADVGAVKIGGDVTGGDGISSGVIVSGAKLASVTIGGRLVGGDGANSGSIFSSVDPNADHDLGSVKITGAMIGGDGANSGAVSAGGRLAKITVGSATTIGPALKGGLGDFSGAIFGQGTVGAVKITGEVEGGEGEHSASIRATVKLTSATITGALKGGTGEFSGSIQGHDRFFVDGVQPGDLGKITVTGGLLGGEGDFSGAIWADGKLASATLGLMQGAAGEFSGAVVTGASLLSDGSTGTVNVLAGIIGGGGIRSGSIEVDGDLDAVKVKNAVTDSAIRVGDALGSVTVGGAIDGTLITARGQVTQTKTDIALAKLTAGSVVDSQILAGYDLDGDPVNGDAQVAAVVVKGNWNASDLVAGVADVDDDGYGDDDDEAIANANANIISRIASVTITGTVSGTPDAVSNIDRFGFVAEQILSFKHGGTKLALDKNVSGEAPPITSATGDVFVREV